MPTNNKGPYTCAGYWGYHVCGTTECMAALLQSPPGSAAYHIVVHIQLCWGLYSLYCSGHAVRLAGSGDPHKPATWAQSDS